MAFWTFVAGYLSGTDRKKRLMYVREAFMSDYGQDPLEMNIIIAQYSETDDKDFLEATWIAIGVLSVVSIASLSMIIYFGYLIIAELKRKSGIMSVNTKKLQTQLIKALVIQTITPTIACFSPCFFSWYQPVFGIDGGKWLQHSSSIVMSLFPVFDPFSTILILPSLRRQFKKTILQFVTKEATVQSNLRTTTCF
ncbi:hypothetical protein GCK72_016477 [Caenorhabditis remanei]|uniref:Uncharacterized protein n=1 Tax=Caenorhabditis remanei TaxID=31234 RepID=A0A6A5G5C9_CAERE|nr:hypothetical protein GCK72_016477 [Caenorhabditis remanei]KAF1749932.1 hypothetical protein GCK72_016477 [Caenorhabditis remanei]